MKHNVVLYIETFAVICMNNNQELITYLCLFISSHKVYQTLRQFMHA